MQKLTILICLIISFFFSNAQHIHNDIEHTISIGLGGVIFPYSSIQIEHTFYKSRFSVGEHLKTFFTIKDNSIFFTGPQIELFSRFYFTDQRIKHGNHWFLHLKGGYGNMSIPWSDNTDDNLNDVNGVLALDVNGNPIKIYNDNLIRYGGGAAFGFKTCTCKDWIFEIMLGYNFWAAPDYYSTEYYEWLSDDCCNYTNYEETKWTYGFPIDFQIKIGKLLGKH